MDHTELKRMLYNVQNGDIEVDDALDRLKHLPYEDLGCATIDHHRALRQGFPEVIFGESKTIGQMEKWGVAPERMAERLLAREELSTDDVKKIAATVADFHLRAERGGEIGSYGSLRAPAR